jgi:hypothetical protein
MKKRIYLQRKNTNMRKVVCLPILFLIVGSSFAQTPWWDDVCRYERINIPRQFINVPLQVSTFDDPPQPPPPADDSYRNIYFIHGLGGNASAWTKVAQACWDASLNIPDFPARMCNTFKLGYTNSTKGSVYEAANDIGQQIRSKAIEYKDHFNVDPDRGIIIAHSQGGIVSRALMHLDFVSNTGALPDIGKGYGGVIFVASPLHGAMILNNRPLLRDMANDACNKLLAGPTSSTLASFIMGKVFGNLGNVCNTFSGDILDLFVSQYYDEITTSYTVGLEGSLIETFDNDQYNTDYCDLPKISIVTQTGANNILWRTANWLVNNPNDETYFGANEEWTFYNNVVEPAYNNYALNAQIFKKKYDNCYKGFTGSLIVGILTGCIPAIVIGVTPSTLLGQQYLDQQNAYQAGVNWLDQANDQWKTVIGARHRDSDEQVWKHEPSDGIVLSNAQANLPCFSWMSGWYSSHMQIRNDNEIKWALKHIFEGYGNKDPNLSKFFYTRQK